MRKVFFNKSKTAGGKLKKAAEVIAIPKAFQVYMNRLPVRAAYLAQVCPVLEMDKDFGIYLLLSCFDKFKRSDLYPYGFYRHKDWWDRQMREGHIEKFDNNSHSTYALTIKRLEWVDEQIKIVEKLWKDHFLKPSLKNSKRILTL